MDALDVLQLRFVRWALNLSLSSFCVPTLCAVGLLPARVHVSMRLAGYLTNLKHIDLKMPSGAWSALMN
eukprot:6814782-Lingulodinium_polyedra.AAC.1